MQQIKRGTRHPQKNSREGGEGCQKSVGGRERGVDGWRGE